MESVFLSQGAAVWNRPACLVHAGGDAVATIGFHRGGAAAERAEKGDCRKTGE
jgi:hypothetical protein